MHSPPNNSKLSFAFATLVVGVALATSWATLQWGFEVIDLPLMYMQHLLYGPFEYFLDPTKYQLLSAANVTPWSSLSLGISYEIFGLEASGARIHHLFSYVLLVLLLSVVAFKLTAGQITAPLAILFLISSDPFINIRDYLICRHYLEGMAFAVLCYVCYHRSCTTGRLAYMALSLGFFMLAITAKEVYAPLPAVLFLVGNVSLRKRIFNMLPFALVCTGYIVWRFHLLHSLGGYSAASESDPIKALTYGALWTTGSYVSSLLLFGALGLTVANAAINRDIRYLLTAATVLVCVFLPFLFLGPLLSEGYKFDRWGFAPLTGLVLLVLAGCKAESTRLLAWSLTCVFAVLTVINVAENQVIANKPHLLAAGSMPEKLLSAGDSDLALDFVGGSYGSMGDLLTTVSAAHWAYLNRIESGEWGYFPLRYPPQMQIHDFTVDDINLINKAKSSQSIARNHVVTDTALPISPEYDPEALSWRFRLPNGLEAKNCYLYFYSSNNGIAVPVPDCSSITLSRGALNGKIRSIDALDQKFRAIAWGQALNSENSLVMTKPADLDVGRITSGK